MDEINDQRLQRKEKLQTLRDLGLSPYGTRYDATHTVQQLLTSHGAKAKEELENPHIPCKIAGRIVAIRRFGKAMFAALQDGGDRLQVYLKKDLLGDESYQLCQQLDLGDWIGVAGRSISNENGRTHG